MNVLHLNTHASGGSYEYAVLLSNVLVEQGIENRFISKSSLRPEPARPFLDRVIRDRTFPFPPSHGMERGDCCLRQRLKRCVESTWCICTQWPIGSMFLVG